MCVVAGKYACEVEYVSGSVQFEAYVLLLINSWLMLIANDSFKIIWLYKNDQNRKYYCFLTFIRYL